MKTSLIIKLNFLVVGLFLVLFSIHSLNKNGLPAGLSALFGGAKHGGQQPNASLKKINWCDTRVQALVQPEGFQLEQVGMKWFAKREEEKEVDFIRVEKWFGKYCSIKGLFIEEASELPLETFKPAFFIKFIKGEVQALGRNDEGVYLWKGQAFTSEELDGALKELAQLVGDEPQD